jgi:hypothetical protein
MRDNDTHLLEEAYDDMVKNFASQIRSIGKLPQEVRNIFNRYGYVEDETVNNVIATSDDLGRLTREYTKRKNPDSLTQIEAILNNWKQIQTANQPQR